jgi:hypothetical protein
MNGRVEVAVREYMAWGLGSGALLGRGGETWDEWRF